MDNLFEQFANISKAHAYDIISDHQKELKVLISSLIQIGDLNNLALSNKEDTLKFKMILNKIKMFL